MYLRAVQQRRCAAGAVRCAAGAVQKRAAVRQCGGAAVRLRAAACHPRRPCAPSQPGPAAASGCPPAARRRARRGLDRRPYTRATYAPPPMRAAHLRAAHLRAAHARCPYARRPYACRPYAAALGCGAAIGAGPRSLSFSLLRRVLSQTPSQARAGRYHGAPPTRGTYARPS
eukprot:1994893-Prymnesium_polylepis.1